MSHREVPSTPAAVSDQHEAPAVRRRWPLLPAWFQNEPLLKTFRSMAVAAVVGALLACVSDYIFMMAVVSGLLGAVFGWNFSDLRRKSRATVIYGACVHLACVFIISIYGVYGCLVSAAVLIFLAATIRLWPKPAVSA